MDNLNEQSADFATRIIDFFNSLEPPRMLPDGVDVLWPFGQDEVRRVMAEFYGRFFGDAGKRVFLIGINPGRFGAGVTGLCFTDPVRLAADCGISHEIPGASELSADFVYRMIGLFGGPKSFYSRFYLTAMSPVGFLKDGRNLNYYDVKGLPETLDTWMADAMAAQIRGGALRTVAFSMGQGKNYKYLCDFNERHGFFERIEALPHPRWVMQYRRKRLDEFLQLYRERLEGALASGRT